MERLSRWSTESWAGGEGRSRRVRSRGWESTCAVDWNRLSASLKRIEQNPQQNRGRDLCTDIHEVDSVFVPQIMELDQDKRDLERQVNELKAKCEQIEKRAVEQRSVEEKKHTEEIQFLKRTNQQLKVREPTNSSRCWVGTCQMF